MTQTLIIHVIRTNKIPFLQSRASWPLTLTTLSIMAFGIWLPYSPLASALGFTHLPRLYWPILTADAARLHGPYASHQSLAAAEEMDLAADCRSYSAKSKSLCDFFSLGTNNNLEAVILVLREEANEPGRAAAGISEPNRRTPKDPLQSLPPLLLRPQ